MKRNTRNQKMHVQGLQAIFDALRNYLQHDNLGLKAMYSDRNRGRSSRRRHRDAASTFS